jgi:hypothetical protein
MRIGLFALLLVPALVSAPVPSPSFSHDEEIRLARSAAPPAITRDARVYVLENGRYVIAQAGHSGAACVLIRIPAEGIEPECGDAEADATVLAVERFQVEQRLAGLSPAEVDRAVADAMVAGRLRLPTRPAMVYMMSSAQVLYDGDTRIGKWKPHVMVFYPYLQAHDLGLPVDDPDARVPSVLWPGTPR